MPTAREDVVVALAVHDAEVLRGLLEAAEVHPRGAESPRALAERITDALWWHSSTPLGYLARSPSLEEITRHVARRLGEGRSINREADAWTMLAQLTEHLGLQVGPVSLRDLDHKAQRRTRGSWIPTSAWAGSSGSSLVARWAGRFIVGVGKGPIGRWLPYIPYLGPTWRVIHKGGTAAAVLGGPLAIASAVLALNSALGPSYGKLVPLLLGVGALGPGLVEDAQELSDADQARAGDRGRP